MQDQYRIEAVAVGVSVRLNELEGAEISAELLFPGWTSMRRVYCDGHGERGFIMVAIPFEWGVREADSMV